MCSKIDIFLQNKHLNMISLFRALSTKVHILIYLSKEKQTGVKKAILWRNADAQ